MATAFIGIGSNLDDPKAQVTRALIELSALPGTRVVAHSALYCSPPMGPSEQPDYINAVAKLETTLAPLSLLDALQALERSHHRVRKFHWGPRTLDLDILIVDRCVFTSERLTLPHPGIAERAFVVIPLYEIAPELTIPGIGPISRVYERFATAVISRL
ncbi:MAG: 2-amino-4-hydroxy-6-hydroxymethyldihydropteridine diphosphokinase [Gammaproteobacteria bacterium]|nr:2-amino-4-hydroxy-6-hydroxymethyldihydropteridine diphosphokinase [Gammaproteobacteria bacterium]